MVGSWAPPALGRRLAGWLIVAAPTGLVLLAVYVFVPRSGDLSGDVFVRLPSGSVERAAGIEVTLVRATDFEAGWAEVATRRDAARPAGAADARAPDAKQTRAAARRVLAILGSSTIQSPVAQMTTTDGTGHYRFPRVPRGRFYVVATHSIPGDQLSWAVPIEIGGGTQRLDLSNWNESWPLPTSAVR
jgi:hypothetical protein